MRLVLSLIGLAPALVLLLVPRGPHPRGFSLRDSAALSSMCARSSLAPSPPLAGSLRRAGAALGLRAPLQPSQEAKPVALAPWTQLTIVDVVPSMVEEYVAIERELTARSREEKTPWRAVSRTEVFGDHYRFVIASPLSSLASFDRKAEPDSRLSSLEERASRCVTRRETYAVRNLPDLSNPLPQGEAPGLMVVNVARVVPGREQDYVNVMKSDFLPHFQEARVHHLSGILALGGESGFLHVFYYESFADLDKGSPVMQALGPEGALAATAKLAGIVSSSSLSVARLIPELSFFPEAKTEKP